MLCTLLFLPRACWPIISTFLSRFDCFLVAELSPLAAHFSRFTRSSHCSQEVNRHILLLPVRLSVLSSPGADCQLRFCFVFYFLLLFSALPLPLPAVLWPKMRHTLRRATVRLWLLCFNWNVFATAAGIVASASTSAAAADAAGSATSRSRAAQSGAQLLSGLELVHNVRVW